jgi:hypothetical protein
LSEIVRNRGGQIFSLLLRAFDALDWFDWLARVIGVGIETADMLVHEILSRKFT